jgi:hypothetical protein
LVRSDQIRAQSISILRIAKHAEVGNAAAHFFAKQGMVNVGTGMMPTASRVLSAHNVEGGWGNGGAAVVVAERNVVDIQMGVDLGLHNKVLACNNIILGLHKSPRRKKQGSWWDLNKNKITHLIDRVGPYKKGIHVVQRGLTRTVRARIIVAGTQLHIDPPHDHAAGTNSSASTAHAWRSERERERTQFK